MSLSPLFLLFLQSAPLPSAEDIKNDIWRILYAWSNIGDLLDGDTRWIEGDKLKYYTFTETTIRAPLDSKGKTGKPEASLYHVIQGPETWQYYRKLISKNGVPLTAEELDKQDREQKKRELKLREESERAARKALKKDAGPKSSSNQAQKREDDPFQLVSSVSRIQVVRRDIIDGYNTVLVTFTPRTDAKPKDTDGKILQSLAVRAWITEQGHQPVRLEIEVLRTMSWGLGLLGKVQAGTKLLLERRRIDGQVWAPVKVEAATNARFLVLKGMNQHQTTTYSDFRSSRWTRK